MGSLIPVDDGPPAARCKLCTRPAVGPCARCRASVCGDCCELTEGGATTFALCLTCVQRGGKSLAGGWLALLGWLGAIILGLVAIAAALLLAGCDGGAFQTRGGTGASSKLALANGYAFWADPLQGLVRGRLDDPAAWTQLSRSRGDGVVDVNATHVFWRSGNEIRRIAQDGGEAELLGTTAAGGAFRLAVDDAAVYYARGETIICRSLVDATETHLVEDRRATSLVLAGDTLVGTTCAGDPRSDAVWRMPADGSAPPRRLVATGCPELAAVDDAFVYYFDDGVGARPGIFRVPLAGGEAVRVIDAPSGVFAVRDAFVYALDGAARVVRIPAAGGEPRLVVEAPVVGFAVDATSIYVTNTDLVLSRVPLP